MVIIILSFAHADTVKTANDYYQQGIAAYQNGNYQQFLENFQMVRQLRPGNPMIAYNLACGFALTGNREESLNILEALSDHGIDFGVDRDPDFASLHDLERFKNICRKLERLRVTINNSEVAYTIPEKDLIPEGIAFDPINQRILLSSIYKRKIISIDKDGNISDFIKSGENQFWGGLGMKVDTNSRVLWACCSWSDQMNGFKEEDSGQASVHKYDLSGNLIKAYSAPGHNYQEFNDLDITRDGDLYITDSHTGEIFYIDHIRDSLELYIPSGNFVGSNGIALSDDEKILFVSAYSEGIYAVNRDNKTYALLKESEKYSTYGIDGLYYYDNSLIGIQNSINPNRVVRYYLNENRDSITGTTIIEMNNNLFDEPTTGTLADDEFYYIANSQLGSFGSDGNIWPIDSLKNVIILKTKLD